MHSTTRLIHIIPLDPLTGAATVPIYQTSTFVQQAPGINSLIRLSAGLEEQEDLVADLEKAFSKWEAKNFRTLTNTAFV